MPTAAAAVGVDGVQALPNPFTPNGDGHNDTATLTFVPRGTAGTAVARGRKLRAEIDRENDPIGVLVVADGANTLTERAPGGYDPGAAEVQLALDDALAGGDAPALTRLGDQILGRVAFQVLAGLTEPGPRTAKELYRGAPYGVGYFAGVWQT